VIFRAVEKVLIKRLRDEVVLESIGAQQAQRVRLDLGLAGVPANRVIAQPQLGGDQARSLRPSNKLSPGPSLLITDLSGQAARAIIEDSPGDSGDAALLAERLLRQPGEGLGLGDSLGAGDHGSCPGQQLALPLRVRGDHGRPGGAVPGCCRTLRPAQHQPGRRSCGTGFRPAR
jgi:hypothetical protein